VTILKEEGVLYLIPSELFKFVPIDRDDFITPIYPVTKYFFSERPSIARIIGYRALENIKVI
jgi:hypothetical protein